MPADATSDIDSISTLNSDDSDADSEFDPRERSMSFVSVDSEHAQESREFDKEASENIVSSYCLQLHIQILIM